MFVFWDGMGDVGMCQARRERFTALAEVEANAVTVVDDDTGAGDEAPGAKRERSLEASVKAVKGLCDALDRRVSQRILYFMRCLFFCFFFKISP